MKFNFEEVAALCHEVNKLYCEFLGDDSQPTWANAPQWQKDSAVAGVEFHLYNPNASPSTSQHEEWLRAKERDGWKYGPVKDPEKKEHPCCIPYEELPVEQKIKDALFTSIVSAVKPIITDNQGEQV